MRLLFHLIGFASALSFLLVGYLLIPDALHGNFHLVDEFFETYQGSEPFMIVVIPIIAIVGPAWLWRVSRSLMKKSQ